MKLLSLFSGIGAFEKALEEMGVAFELAGYCEIDKYASRSYAAIHGVAEDMNRGDIKQIDATELPTGIDMITYGFPCQDISAAGKQKGMYEQDGTLTRSGLFFEALRIIESAKPKVAIAENVKNLTGKKFKEQFQIILQSLTDAGYNNYWSILNAKDFGVPQNRERVFIVSIRKDIDTGMFEFPGKKTLKTCLFDILEKTVDEKYYTSKKMLTGMEEHRKKQRQKGNGFGANIKTEDEISPTITARYHKDGSNCLIKQQKVIQLGNCYPTKTRSNPNQGRVYDTNGISPTLGAMQGGGRQPFIVASRGRNPEKPSDRTVGMPTIQRLEPNTQGMCNTLTSVQKDNLVVEPGNEEDRIRRLTPKECFRLMGFKDEDFNKAAEVNSDTQLYKQAGNSIVVPVLEAIMEMIYRANIL